MDLIKLRKRKYEHLYGYEQVAHRTPLAISYLELKYKTFHL